MGQKWLGIEDSNLCHLSQSQAYYHYTNPQLVMPEDGPGGFGGKLDKRIPP